MSLLDPIKLHPDWKSFITDEVLDLVFHIETQINKVEFTPSAEKVFRFMELSLLKAKIVILGQDPYPQPGIATGRAFEVGGMKSWNQPFNNISLKNILRAIYKAYTGTIITYKCLKEKFDNEFPVYGPALLFSYWESQGIVLLNTSFTCETGKPGSQRKIWEDFSRRLLSYINITNHDIIWFLWGNDALNAVSHLEGISALKSSHPMICFDSPKRDNDLLFGKVNCFAETKCLIDWTGYGLKYSPGIRESLF